MEKQTEKLLTMKSHTVINWLGQLRCWNLKYNDFPKIEVVDNLVSISYYQSGGKREEIIEFVSEAEAVLFLDACSKAMKSRSDEYWQVH